MPYTIKDIAKAAGVSVATVSRALNNSSLIKKETMDKIKAAAEELNYVPNSSAKSLVMNRSFNIGLFFTAFDPGVTSGFFYKLSLTVEKLIRDRYHLIIRSINDYKDYSVITRKLFDGVIVVSQTGDDDAFIKHLLKIKLPVVVVNRVPENIKVDTFYSDEHDAVRKLVKYLIKMGHKKIAFVKGKKGTFSAQKRFQGYVDALNESGIVFDDTLVFDGNYSLAAGYDAMRKIIALKDVRPSAVFFSNDDMAFGGAKFIYESGMKIPADYSIVGFDDTKYASYMSPELTTINRPVEVILKDAAKRLIEKIENKNIDSTISKCIDAKLMIRDSILNIKR